METYYGFVRTAADAIRLFEACRLGLLPKVQRRLSAKERQSIRSGSVFVWDEREAGMRRWTDGKSWSASRVSGNFLTYRETEGKTGNGFGSSGRIPNSGPFKDEDPNDGREGYQCKADGLVKQSFSIATSQGQHLHLISYYSRPQHNTPELTQPTLDASLRHIVPAKGMYPGSSLQDTKPLALTRTPIQPYTTQPPSPEPSQYPNAWRPHQACMVASIPSPSGTPPWVPHMSANVKAHAIHKLRPRLHLQPHVLCPHMQPLSPRSSRLPPSTTYASSKPFLSPRPPGLYEQNRLRPVAAVSAYPPIQTTATSTSPSPQQLQHAATPVVMIDPCFITTSALNPQDLVPAMPAAATRLAPSRTHCISPPRTAGSNAGSNTANPSSQGSLSALFQPTAANSQPSSGSASSSQRTLASVPGTDPYNNQDAKAIRSLDRKFHA